MAEQLLRYWTERIDGQAFAANAMVTETRRGVVYGASTVLLVEHGRHAYRWASEVAEKLRKEVAAGKHKSTADYIWFGGGETGEPPRCVCPANFHGLPAIGTLRDLRR